MVSLPPSVLQQCVLTQGVNRDFTACEGPCMSSAEFEGYGSDEEVTCGKMYGVLGPAGSDTHALE